MRIRVDKRSETAVYKQISGQLRAEFASGRARAGDRLPSLRELAEHAGVSVESVRRAYADLESKGWIETEARSGSVVTRAGTKMGVRERITLVMEKADDLWVPHVKAGGMLERLLRERQAGARK